ncbi:expressed unknown protein [Seminavis robusta]|uniref:Uncharacterized protein n=1 Tax=Seminavis robusta TaxID=568900 RepID=A0A9N8E1A4_9STRA|nr:expressed unknown protein [Seminavis robusta]|eukprot:Sro407_g136670.1 n/a (1317) ;mRNA; r:36021-39971
MDSSCHSQLRSCPCSSPIESTVGDAIVHDEQHRRLVDWLAASTGSTKDEDVECSSTPCTVADCRVRRVMVSFYILKELRAACKPFLESSTSSRSNNNSSSNSEDGRSPQKKHPPPMTQPNKPIQESYQDQFPSLASQQPQQQQTQKHDNSQERHQGKKKKKKRIRPVAAVAPAQGSSGVWGEIAKQTPMTTNTAFSSSSTSTKSWPRQDSHAWAKPQQNNFPPLSTANKPPIDTHNAKQTGAKAWGNNTATATRDPPQTTTQPRNNIGSQTLIIGSKNTAKINNKTTSKEFKTTVGSTKQDLLDGRKHVTFGIGPENQSVVNTPIKVASTTASSNNNNNNHQDNNDDLNRFVDIYCTLIWKNLVPSTVLELHLLMRLLHVKGNKENAPTAATCGDNQQKIFADTLFGGNDEHRVLLFAVKALRQLAPWLQVFGLSFWKDLIQSTAFRTHLPDLTKQLEDRIHKDQSSSALSSTQTTFASQTALLTLSFQHERDSRHHFKSQDEKTIYKNREETRDAFLYQLRAFLSIKGKVLEAQKQMAKIKSNCRVVLYSVMTVNLPWFAQFFCELLLQVGLVPLQENDKELFALAGSKEKLQKLHKRFSSKFVNGSGVNYNNTKLTFERNNKKHATIAPEEQAKEYFTGHQEFFFLFIMSTDSHRFNRHLQHQLVHLIRSSNNLDDGVGGVSSNNQETPLEEKMLKLQMLARFLGVIVFCPSWQEVSGKSTSVLQKGSDVAPVDLLHQLQRDPTGGLDLLDAVRASQNAGTLSLTTPWVIEFLKMASWDDTIGTRSRSYVQLVMMLREIQRELKCSLFESFITQQKTTPTFLVAVWCLESFFGEHVGLTEAASIPLSNELPSSTGTTDNTPILPRDEEKEQASSTIDATPLSFRMSTLFAVNPRLEDLVSLVSHLSRDDNIRASARSPGISRKLRPLMLSKGVAEHNGTGSLKNASADNPIDKLLVIEEAPAIAVLSATTASNKNSLEAKMVDTFFHQHKALKAICEFSVHRLLKSILGEIHDRYQDTSADATALVDDALEFLRASLEAKMDQSLTLLEPPDTPIKIHQLAVSLAVARGFETGAPLVRDLVVKASQEHVEKDLDTIQRCLFQGTTDHALDRKEPTHAEVLAAQLSSLTRKLNELKSRILDVLDNEASFDLVIVTLKELEPMVDEFVNSKNPRMPPEKQSRDHFEAIAELDEVSVRFVQFCIDRQMPPRIDSGKRWVGLDSFLHIASMLSVHPRRGFARIRRFFWDLESLEQTIRFSLETGSGKEVAERLTALANTTLLSPRRVEEVEVRAMRLGQDDIVEIAKAIVNDSIKSEA